MGKSSHLLFLSVVKYILYKTIDYKKIPSYLLFSLSVIDTVRDRTVTLLLSLSHFSFNANHPRTLSAKILH